MASLSLHKLLLHDIQNIKTISNNVLRGQLCLSDYYEESLPANPQNNNTSQNDMFHTQSLQQSDHSNLHTNVQIHETYSKNKKQEDDHKTDFIDFNTNHLLLQNNKKQTQKTFQPYIWRQLQRYYKFKITSEQLCEELQEYANNPPDSTLPWLNRLLRYIESLDHNASQECKDQQLYHTLRLAQETPNDINVCKKVLQLLCTTSPTLSEIQFQNFDAYVLSHFLKQKQDTSVLDVREFMQSWRSFGLEYIIPVIQTFDPYFDVSDVCKIDHVAIMMGIKSSWDETCNDHDCNDTANRFDLIKNVSYFVSHPQKNKEAIEKFLPPSLFMYQMHKPTLGYVSLELVDNKYFRVQPLSTILNKSSFKHASNYTYFPKKLQSLACTVAECILDTTIPNDSLTFYIQQTPQVKVKNYTHPFYFLAWRLDIPNMEIETTAFNAHDLSSLPFLRRKKMFDRHIPDSLSHICSHHICDKRPTIADIRQCLCDFVQDNQLVPRYLDRRHSKMNTGNDKQKRNTKIMFLTLFSLFLLVCIFFYMYTK